MNRSVVSLTSSCVLFVACVLFGGCGGGGGQSAAQKTVLGALLFSDTSLSNPPGQSCATCHNPKVAFTDSRPGSDITSQGTITGRFGNRQTPTIMYMAYSIPLHFEPGEGWLGGQFWDGHAATLADQAGPPMLNPIEMNNASKEEVVAKVRTGHLKRMMEQVYGQSVFDDTNIAFADIRDAIAAFEKTSTFAPFSSKYDAYLAGRTNLTAEEADGLAIFNGKAGCGNCHISTSPPGSTTPPLFTDYGYDNLGVPKNPDNKFYTDDPAFNPDGASFIDRGLGKVTGNPADDGKFKAPTLRNLAITAPYFHNGFAKDMTEAVQFYNKRDSGIFGPAEIPGTINTDDLGDLGLTDEEVAHIVAFMSTLTDGWKPAPQH